jgi:hypothetical protein
MSPIPPHTPGGGGGLDEAAVQALINQSLPGFGFINDSASLPDPTEPAYAGVTYLNAENYDAVTDQDTLAWRQFNNEWHALGAIRGGVVAHVENIDGNFAFTGEADYHDDVRMTDIPLQVPGDGIRPTVIIATIPQLSVSNASPASLKNVRVTLRDDDGNYIGGFTQAYVAHENPTGYTAFGLLPPHVGDKIVHVHVGCTTGESGTVINDDLGPLDVSNVSRIVALR